MNVGLPADNVELGTACGKLHRVSVLAITDPGASVSASASISAERSKGLLSATAVCNLRLRMLLYPPRRRLRHHQEPAGSGGCVGSRLLRRAVLLENLKIVGSPSLGPRPGQTGFSPRFRVHSV